MTDFQERLAAARAKAGVNTPTPPTPPALPTAPPAPAPVEFMASKRSRADQAIDSLIDGLDIITAYNKYAGKGTVDPKGKTESVMISCPNPAHPDRNPSAWINTEKGTWFCAGCNEGGDALDIAAWHFGLPVPGYKQGSTFHTLRKRIAEDHGYVFQRTIAGDIAVAPVGPAGNAGVHPSPARPGDATAGDGPGAVGDGGDGATSASGGKGHLSVVPPDATVPADDAASVTELPGLSAMEELEDVELGWEKIVPKGTFLDVWMQQTTVDDVPEEYHFWNGMLAISLALGKDVTLKDFRPVYGNLFICILGRTGSGKSKAKYYLDQLLEETMPYKAKDPADKGVLRASGIASAEAMIWMFKKVIDDPTAPAGTKPKEYPVRGLIDYNELAGLVGRTQRSGNVLIPTLMQFYDVESTVETISRTHGVERASDPYACAITTSQPKSLRGLLTVGDAASGFLNRWFFAAGKEKTRSAIGGAKVDILPAVKPLSEIKGWADTAGELEWSQDAEDMFTAFFHDELHPMQRKDDTDLLNRMDLLCKKLILLFTANMKHDMVQPEAVRQMMKVYPYLLECYGIPGAHVGSSQQHMLRDTLLRFIVDHQKKTGKGASIRDITRKISGKQYPLDMFNRTLKYMVEIEEIIVMPTEGGGRPTTRYGVADVTEWDFRKKQNSPAEKEEAV